MILSARYANSQNDGVFLETDDRGLVLLSQRDAPAEWQALLESDIAIAPYAPPVLTGEARVIAIKAEARRRILTIAPEWRQANLTARAAELALLYPNLRGEELSEPERAEYLAGQVIWDRIKAVRAASDALEQSDAKDIADDRHWPE